MRVVDVIRKKRDGNELSAEELSAFVEAATQRSWPDYQLSALLMAICIRGLSAQETAHLTHSMAYSGTRLDLSDIPGPKIDKHSTGGVGDKTSLILAPLAAACGVIVPMMSGRGLGHTGGTLDKLESIAGFRVHLEESEFRSILQAIGVAMIGQTATIAPADRTLYALRDVTGTVESIPLITASILSKKIAEGIEGLVLDVKAGQGAFMKTLDDARALGQSLVRVATANGLTCRALITNMEAPLGCMVGNALEVQESIAVLKDKGPADLRDLSVQLAAQMVLLGGICDTIGEAETRVRKALESGAGLEKFRELVQRQGGDPRVIDDDSLLPVASGIEWFRAPRDGWVTAIDAEAVGIAAMDLGAGRQRSEDAVDHSVGIILHRGVGSEVKTGDILAEIRHHQSRGVASAVKRLTGGYTLSDRPGPPAPIILEQIEC